MDKVQIEYAEFILGDKEFKVPALGLAASETWRGRFMDEVNEILGLLKSQGGVFEGVDLGNIRELANVDIMQLLPVIGLALNRLNISMNRLGELISMYNIDLDTDYILKNATMKQAVVALIEMVKLEYPFGLLTRPSPTLNGQVDTTTSKSLPLPSGE